MIEGQTFEGREQNLKHAGKLLAIYSRQIEVLDKHRGKGQQKVTVEHVHVEAGGQAMVGHIETGKTAGARRAGAEPEVKTIPDDPGETIDMDLEVKKSEPSRKSGGSKMAGNHRRNTDPMLASPRCGARTRSGRSCRSPVVHG